MGGNKYERNETQAHIHTNSQKCWDIQSKNGTQDSQTRNNYNIEFYTLLLLPRISTMSNNRA